MHIIHSLSSKMSLRALAFLTIFSLVLSATPAAFSFAAVAPGTVTIGIEVIPNPGAGNQETITLSNTESYPVTIEQLEITDRAHNILKAVGDQEIAANDTVTYTLTQPQLNNDEDDVIVQAVNLTGPNMISGQVLAVNYDDSPNEGDARSGFFEISLTSGEALNVTTNTYFATLEEAIEAAESGDEISLEDDVETEAEVVIDTPLTLEGNGYVITTTATHNGNAATNSVIEIFDTTNVTLIDIEINGIGGTDIHGINIFNATAVHLEDIKILNNDRSAVNIAGSEVVIDRVETAGNGENSSYNVINAAKGTDTDQEATLEIFGVSTHAEDPTQKLHVGVSTEATPNFTDTETQYQNVTVQTNAFLVANGADPLPSNTQTYVLAGSLPDPEPEPEVPEMMTITGTKYVVGETGSTTPYTDGWLITLTNNDTDEIASTTQTNGVGNFGFAVTAGQYTVSEASVSGWEQVRVEKNGQSVDGTECTFPSGKLDLDMGTSHTCNFYNQVIVTDENDDSDKVSESGSGSQSTRVGTRQSNVESVQRVAGAATTTAATVATETVVSDEENPTTCPFMTDFLHIEDANDSFAVTKLQLFFSIVMGYESEVTGVFDDATFANVKRFQLQYQSEILEPWGISEPTGYLYKTTRWKMNDLVCPGSATFPTLTEG